MPHTCKCGGRYNPLDSNPCYFRVKCGTCGTIKKQKKRRDKIEGIGPVQRIGPQIFNVATGWY